MEAVATHPLREERLGDRIAVGDLRMAPMKGRIETGNLKQARLTVENDADRGEVVGLVQGCQRSKQLELAQDRSTDDRRQCPE